MKKRRIGGFWRAFIPRYVPGGAVLGVLEALRAVGRRRAGGAAPPAPLSPERGFLEDQLRYGALPYGRSTLRDAGCEAIAACNALWALEGARPTLQDAAAEFARDGMLRTGLWGASPGALRDFLRRRGYAAELTRQRAEAERFLAQFDVVLPVMYNDAADITAGLHTVCAHRENGAFYAHNVHGDGRVSPPCVSLAALEGLWGGCGKLLCMIGVGRKNQKKTDERE